MYEDEEESMWIMSLKKFVRQKDWGMIGSFQDAIAEGGTPLIEDIYGDNENVLVTFLWESDDGQPADNVVLISDLYNRWWYREFQESSFTPIYGTGYWYLTRKMNKEIRETYKISVNDEMVHWSEVNDGETFKRVSATWRTDPLNKTPFTIPKADGSEEIWSYFELDNAPPQPLIIAHAGVAKGQLSEHRLNSKQIEGEQRLWLYRPPNVQVGMPLVVLLDGWDYHNAIPTPIILDNLIAEGRIPPTAAVLVDTPKRIPHLDCSEAFAGFLANEVVPWARSHLSLTAEPEQILVGGVSLGGLQAAFTALKHPEVFGGVIAQSGSFWRGTPGVWGETIWSDPNECWLIQQFVTTPTLPIRFYIEAGRHENPSDHKTITLLRSSRYLRDVLRAKGYDVTYHEFEGGHRYVCWRGTLGEGIVALLKT